LLSSARIKQLKSLHQKKFRRQENRFLLEGYHLIDQIISSNAEIEEIWITKKSLESPNGKNLIKQIENENISWSIAPNKIIRQISDSLNDQGIIALAPIPIYKKYKIPPKRSIYLDGISDPGNMGALLRTAAWFGIQSVFRSPECVDPFNSKVVRSAMGAHFYFSHFETITKEKIKNNFIKSGIEVFGADMEGSSINSLNVSDVKGWILILGSEAHGISESSRDLVTTMVAIPGVKGMESLNVSVAGGILLHALTSPNVVTN
tara:strand:- start:33 stop:818 length:786 start_codon:yes stop_codon:yes gene_type:complete